MLVPEYEKEAIQFCAAIKKLAEKPENLDVLERYLAHCFGMWMKERANNPKSLTQEIEGFSKYDEIIEEAIKA